MSVGHIIALVLLVAGVAVIVAASLGALCLSEPLDRLHYVTPVTSLGAPLVGVSLAVANGWGLTTGLVLLTVASLAVSGATLASATGRMLAEQGALMSDEVPE